MDTFASLADVAALWRPLTSEELTRAATLLETVTASLVVEANKVGVDLRQRVLEDEDFAQVAKSVTVDVVARALMTSTNSEPLTQFSQSALGYSASGTYLVPGGGLFIKRSELARLGLRRQTLGGVELWHP